MSSSMEPQGATTRIPVVDDDLRRELEAANRQLSALLAASADTAATLSLDELLRRMADGVVQTLGYTVAALVLLVPEQKEVSLGALSGMPLPLVERVESLLGVDMTRPARTSDYMISPAFRAWQAGEVFSATTIVQLLHPPLPESVCAQMQELIGPSALAALPLLSRGRLVGGLLVVSAQPTFSPEEIGVLRAVADQAAVAVGNARLRASAAASEERARLLLDIQSAIAARLQLHSILTLVVGGAARAVHARSGLLALVDPNTQEPVGQASYGLPVDADPSQVRLNLAAGVRGQVIGSGRSLRVDDVRSLVPPDPLAARFGLRSLTVVAIRSGDRVIGVLSVHDRLDGLPFTAGDEELLAAIADQAAVAIDQARLYEEVQHRAQELAALNLIAQTAGRSLDLQEILESSLERVLDVTDVPSGAIYLPDATREQLTLVTQRNMPQRMLDRMAVVGLDQGLVSEVFHLGRATLSSHPSVEDPGYPIVADEDSPLSVALVPLQAKDEVLGVMMVGGSAHRTVTGQDLALLTAIGHQIGLAVENARLYAEARQRVRELALLNEVAIAAGESLDLGAVLAQTLSHMQAVTRADQLAAYVREGYTSTFYLRATLGFPKELRSAGRGVLATDPFSEVLPHEVTVLNDLSELRSPGAIYLREHGLQSVILVPLRSRGTTIGSIYLLFTTPRAVGATEQQLLDTIGRQVSTAVENAQLYQETRRLAITDGLTGLYNYRYFYEILGREVERVRRYDGGLTLVMLDIDDFKEYNDLYGHLAGDDLLADLAQLLLGQVRTVDTAARYGGEEIAILLPETGKPAAASMAERIRQQVASHTFGTQKNGEPGRITVSLGVAASPDDAKDARGLVHAADMALYAAKRAGKNCVRVAEG